MRRILIPVTIAVLFIVTDFGFRFYLILHAPNLEALRLSRPAAYADTPYWSREFVLEYRHIGNDLADSGYWKTADYAGRWYNFRDGQRLVPNAPERYERTVWLFGNSGLLDPWVPDDYTAAARLQGLLNAYGYRWRVVNQSANGQKIAGEVAWLRETPLQAGDIVIFVDGSMDAMYIRESSKPVALWLLDTCKGDPGHWWSASLTWLVCQAVDGIPPDAQAVASQVARYNRVVDNAQQYAAAHGATLYHFLQPYDGEYRLEGMQGTPIDAPPAMFLESSHMNGHGAEVEARAIFDSITIF